MILIVCLDEKGGMLFNKRRQSKDAVVRDRVQALASGKKLWMNNYSLKQFENNSEIICDEDFLKKAQNGDYCFAEDMSLKNYEQEFEKIIVFKWNRIYPSDLKFDIDLKGWKLQSSQDFVGKSHDKITEEVYVK